MFFFEIASLVVALSTFLHCTNSFPQVGNHGGPLGVHKNNGSAIRGPSIQEHVFPPRVYTEEQDPMFTHSIFISGANIVNLPVPGVGADSI